MFKRIKLLIIFLSGIILTTSLAKAAENAVTVDSKFKQFLSNQADYFADSFVASFKGFYAGIITGVFLAIALGFLVNVFTNEKDFKKIRHNYMKYMFKGAYIFGLLGSGIGLFIHILKGIL